jgi:hypothetical protein
MAIAKVIQYRALSVEQLADNAKVSQTATELARANERAENNRRADEIQAQIDAEIAAAGGLSRMSQHDADRLWGLSLKILRLRG